jgi:integrase
MPTYGSVRQVLVVVCRAKKIPFGGSSWRIHDIRHTAASVLAEASVSHSIIAALLGHRLGGVTALYTHATLTALNQAVDILAAYWLGASRRLKAVK